MNWSDLMTLDREVAVNTRKTLIVAGIGRSGTGYLTELLSESGLNARHKYVFRGGRYANDGVLSDRVSCARCLNLLDVEVSGFAMPHLEEPAYRGYPVAQLVRHPLAWLRSWSTKCYAASYVERHLGFRPRQLRSTDLYTKRRAPKFEFENVMSRRRGAIEDALRIWCEWNAYVAERASIWMRLEEIDLSALRSLAILAGAEARFDEERAKQALEFTPLNFNSASYVSRPPSERRTRLRWNDLPDSIWRRRARAMAKRFGYGTKSTTMLHIEPKRAVVSPPDPFSDYWGHPVVVEVEEKGREE